MITEASTKATAQTKGQIARSYGICVRTLNNWLSRFPEIVIDAKTKILTPEQVKMIYDKIGEP